MDCVLISDYRYNNIAQLCERYRLVTWSTGMEMDYCFAVNRDQTTLFSILAKVTAMVPMSTVDAALTHHFTEDAGTSAFDSLSWILMVVVGCALALVALVILGVLLRGAWAEKGKGRRGRIPTRSDFALFDDLPFSYCVYHVTHAEHSEVYDTEVLYAN
ncbi:MAG: hypothetical protein IKF14_03520 [Atopobiaceae bacterium]|nr:hypothetical protein [Atopobiaceae bacterium]